MCSIPSLAFSRINNNCNSKKSKRKKLSLSHINSTPMASIQCSKPVEQTAMVCQKTTTETCYSKAHQEHSFTDKLKEMAHSATKIFEHKNKENSGQHCHLTHGQHGVANTHTPVNHKTHAQQSGACHCPGTSNSTTTHKKEGHGGNFIANIGEHIKNLTSKKKNRKNKAGNCNDSSSGSSSGSDESDNETCEKKDCL